MSALVTMATITKYKILFFTFVNLIKFSNAKWALFTFNYAIFKRSACFP